MDPVSILALGLVFNDAVTEINEVVNQPKPKEEIVRKVQVREGYQVINGKKVFVIIKRD